MTLGSSLTSESARQMRNLSGSTRQSATRNEDAAPHESAGSVLSVLSANAIFEFSKLLI